MSRETNEALAALLLSVVLAVGLALLLRPQLSEAEMKAEAEVGEFVKCRLTWNHSPDAFAFPDGSYNVYRLNFRNDNSGQWLLLTNVPSTTNVVTLRVENGALVCVTFNNGIAESKPSEIVRINKEAKR